MKLFTIGHSTRTSDELVALLKGSGVDLLADVRTVPRSRTNPQFNSETLAETLAAAGIGYRHMKALGGLRGPQKLDGPSPNTYWRNEGFRNYADYALTPKFHAGLDELRGLADMHTCVVMCAENLWWRCHRRIITDYLVAGDDEVIHILGADNTEPGRLTPEAEVQAGGTLHYPAAQGTLL